MTPGIMFCLSEDHWVIQIGRRMTPPTPPISVDVQVFQLLLPEVPEGESGNGPLLLLALISVVAPLLAWAADLVGQSPSSPDILPG